MGILSWDDAFSDAIYLKIMYHLAKTNPSIEAKRIAESFNLNINDVEERLVKLAKLNIVDFEKDKGYTLTDRGLMSLYNFHTNFNK